MAVSNVPPIRPRPAVSPRVGRDERVAPGARRAGPSGRLAGPVVRQQLVLGNDPPVVAGDADSLLQQRSLRQLGRLEADDEHGLGAVQACASGGQRGVEQPQVCRPQPGLGDVPGGLVARLPRREPDAAGRAEPGSRLDPHPGTGDDAEDALGSDGEPVRVRAGARSGQPPRLPPAGRREHPHRLDELVDVRVVGRVVPAGAGRDPAAERRPGKALREMPQRVPARPELVLQVRAKRPGLDQRGPGDLVYLEDLVQLVQRDGDDGSGAVRRGDAADHRAAAAVRDRAVALVRAPGQDRLHLRLGARVRDHVGRVRVVAANAVYRPLAAIGVVGALPGTGEAERGQVIRRSYPRGAKVQRVGRRDARRGQLHTELLRQLRSPRGTLLVAWLLGLRAEHPQTPPWPRALAHTAAFPHVTVLAEHRSAGNVQTYGNARWWRRRFARSATARAIPSVTVTAICCSRAAIARAGRRSAVSVREVRRPAVRACGCGCRRNARFCS